MVAKKIKAKKAVPGTYYSVLKKQQTNKQTNAAIWGTFCVCWANTLNTHTLSHVCISLSVTVRKRERQCVSMCV